MYLIQGVRSHISRCCAAWIVCLTALSLFGPFALSAHAAPGPQVTFVGAQSTVGISSDWSGPVGVAADTKGNLFVASYLGHYISEVNLATGVATRIPDFTVSYPQDMKISGDTLYIASQGENLIKGYSLTTHSLVRSLSMGGIFALAINSAGDIYAGVDNGSSSKIYVFPAGSSTPTLVKGSGLTSMTGLAVDSTGMLYAADTSANIIYKIDPPNGYASTVVPISVTSPRGMVIDDSDQLYLSAAGTINMNDGRVYRYPSGSYNTASGVMLAQKLNYNEEITIASNGDEYVSSFNGNSVIRISPQSNFGTIVPVGSSATQTLVFSIGAGTTLGATAAGTTDTSFGSFAVYANTCVPGYYPTATTCSMTLQYSPDRPAMAHGIIQIADGTGTTLSTVFSSGIGVAPMLALTPNIQSLDIGIGPVYGIVPLPNQNAAVTTDTSLFVGNFAGAAIPIATGLVQAHQIAVDALNNLYISDTGNNRIVTIPGTSALGLLTPFSTSTSAFTGVAVDGAGSVYYSDYNNNQILRRDWADIAYGPEVVAASGVSAPGPIAVDNAHNLYVLSGNNLRMLAWQNGAYSPAVDISTSLNVPTSISLDGAGDLYVSNSGDGTFLMFPHTASGYGAPATLLANQGDVQQAIIQSDGALYLMGGNTGKVTYADRVAGAPLAFGSTMLNTVSTDSPLTIQAQNIGTADLTFSAQPNGNPSTDSTSFLRNASLTTCPVATAAATTLPVGVMCTVAIDYNPQTLSSTTATLTFTDDALNVAGTTQSVPMSGSVTAPVPTVTGISPASGYVAGGDIITITGQNFTGAMGVFVADVPVSFTFNSDTSITIAVPSVSSAQVVDIRVATAAGRSAISAADQYTYIAQTPTLAFAGIGAHTYGETAFTVSASSASSGAITYTVVSGPATVSGNRVTITGAGAVTLQASQAAGGSYSTATANVSFTVAQATPVVTTAPTGNNAYGATLGSQVSSTATLNGTAVPGTYSYTVTPAGGSSAPATAGTVLGAGSYTVTTTFTPTDTANYKPVVSSTSLTVTAQPITVSISTSATTIAPGQSITFSVVVAGASGPVPDGTITITDGGTVLGTVLVSNGVATFTTSSLSPGTHVLSATYSGNGNYGTSSSATGVTNVTVASFDFTLTTTGTTYQTVIPGSSTSYSFALAPTTGTYPAAVTFAVTGLPAGASYTITPSTVAANGGATTAVLTVKTASLAASNQSSPMVGGAASAVMALILLPFATARRLRKAGTLGRVLMLALFIGAGLLGMAGLTGCGSGNGFLGQSPRDYTITVTASSGTAQHASTVTLNLQ